MHTTTMARDTGRQQSRPAAAAVAQAKANPVAQRQPVAQRGGGDDESWGQYFRNKMKSWFPVSPHNYHVRSRYGEWMPPFLKEHRRSEDLQELVESDSRYSAPRARGPLSTEPVQQNLPVFGPIEQSYDPETTTVTNQTTPQHLLHDGEVTHQYDFPHFQRDTTGTGMGIWPGVNENPLSTNLMWRLQPSLRLAFYKKTIGNWWNSPTKNKK